VALNESSRATTEASVGDESEEDGVGTERASHLDGGEEAATAGGLEEGDFEEALEMPVVYYDHPIREDLIDYEAGKVVSRLKRFGYEAYLVGGCVRDIALDTEPKDFDVATSASPKQVRRVFRNCRIIGRRFRLCHVFFRDKIIEVATFRTDRKPEEEAVDQADPTAGDDEGGVASWEVEDTSELRERVSTLGRSAQALEDASAEETVDLDDNGNGDEAVDPEVETPEDTGAGASLLAAIACGTARQAANAEDRGESSRDRDGDRDRDRDRGRGRGRRGGRRRRRYEDIDDEKQVYGTAEEDANLRDFTINALFYDPEEDCVIDYVGGWEDLEDRIIRVIGDPDERMIEDPVRILRAVKTTARSDMRIELLTWEAMKRNADKIETCASRRLLEEVFKLLACGAARKAFRMLAELKAIPWLLPELAAEFPRDVNAPAYLVLAALDRVPKAQLDPALLVAALHYTRIRERWAEAGVLRPGEAPPEGEEVRADREVIAESIAEEEIGHFAKRGCMSRRNRAVALRMIMAQRLLRKPRSRRAARLVARDWFELAFLLLEIVLRAEGEDLGLLRLWRRRRDEVLAGDFDESDLGDDVPRTGRRRRSRRRRRPRGG
jgi:tRNA nucleotidyltransferase/poly(A) polymerase